MADSRQGEIVARCERCGGTDVQIAMWVRPNTGQVLDAFGSHDATDTAWCERCDAHVTLVTGSR